MATTIRTTKTSRIILELDGCSDYYDGALVQGNVACKISLPKTVSIHTNTDGEQFFSFDGLYYWHQEIAKMANRGEIKGARVYEFRIIQ